MKQLFVRAVTLCLATIPLPERIRDLFMWPLATRVLGKEYDTPFRTRAGFKLHAYLDDQLGRLALFYGPRKTYFWEPETTRLLERIVQDARHVLIAGTHIGLTALYAQRAAGSTGIVHTFEPIPYLYNIAKRNFALNPDCGGIRINNVALGDTPGVVTMTSDRIRSRILIDGNNPKELDTEEVPVTTIDHYANEHSIQSFDVVFLDVEGYELRALTGMHTLLSTRPPRDIIYEVSFPYKDDLAAARALEAYLAPFGYHFYIVEDNYNPVHYAEEDSLTAVASATPSTYKMHETLKYFNVYATLRSRAEVKKITGIVGCTS